MKRLISLVVCILFSAQLFADPVWLDVRTAKEYAQEHIEGDTLIPHNADISVFEKAFPDKNTELYLYCRSGRRAGIAVNKLKEAGYTNVTNAGGIEDAKAARELKQQ